MKSQTEGKRTPVSFPSIVTGKVMKILVNFRTARL